MRAAARGGCRVPPCCPAATRGHAVTAHRWRQEERRGGAGTARFGGGLGARFRNQRLRSRRSIDRPRAHTHASPSSLLPPPPPQATEEEVAELAALFDEAEAQVEAAIAEVAASPAAAKAAASPAIAKAKAKKAAAAAAPAKASTKRTMADLEAGIDDAVNTLQSVAELED